MCEVGEAMSTGIPGCVWCKVDNACPSLVNFNIITAKALAIGSLHGSNLKLVQTTNEY